MIAKVLRNKNKAEKLEKLRRSEDLARLRAETAFMARLSEEMKLVDTILRDPEVNRVTIEIPEKQLTLFTRAIYREEMTPYSIIQVGDTTFEVGRRIINL